MRNFQTTKYNIDDNDLVKRNSSYSYDDSTPASSNTIIDLFNEYKKQFEARKFANIENIVLNMESIDPNSLYLDIINGEQYLFHGNCEKSYFHLNKYLTKADDIDPYALGVIAAWNESAGYYSIAYSQFAARISYPIDIKSMAWFLFSAITNKKRCKFLNTALVYYERLLAIPEGYKLLRCIKIEIAHLYILKRNFQAAMSVINQYSRFRQCIFIKRLRVYINYIERNYGEILKYKNDKPLDPYIGYIIGRIGLDNPGFNLDTPYYLEESIKQGGNSAYVYNSYGNYFMKMKRFSSAAEQYNNAYAIDSSFEPVQENLNLIKKTVTSFGESVYVPNIVNGMLGIPLESDPDVEDMGFLNINSLLGYAKFKKTPYCHEKMLPLRLLSQLFKM